MSHQLSWQAIQTKLWPYSGIARLYSVYVPFPLMPPMLCALPCEIENKRPVGLSSFVNCPPVVASFLKQRQLRINAGWQHMGRVPHPNYVDPECCVATVCHQVRFMYWEHLGHFQRATSHLKGHKIVCMRYLACAFSQMKSTDMFSMYLQSGVPRHFIWWFIAGWT